MLLWEALRVRPGNPRGVSSVIAVGIVRTGQLPLGGRCSAVTKSGRRCRGRARNDTEFCPFHDPTVSEERRRQIASRGGRNHHRLARMPDGYLRKLTSRWAVGEAMDRLYREVRLGVVTAEMGTVLLSVLTRILDSGLYHAGRAKAPSSRRAKADRIRPKLNELLTHAERAAWRKAVVDAPALAAQAETCPRPAHHPASSPASERQGPDVVGSPGNVALQVAS